MEPSGGSVVDLGTCHVRVRSTDPRLYALLASTADDAGEYPMIDVRYDEHPWPRWWVNEVPTHEHDLVHNVHRQLLDLALRGTPALSSGFAVVLHGVGILVSCPDYLRDPILAAFTAAGAEWIAADAVAIGADGTALSHRVPSLMSSSTVSELVYSHTSIGGATLIEPSQLRSRYTDQPAHRLDRVLILAQNAEPEVEITELTAANAIAQLTDSRAATEFWAAAQLLNARPQFAYVIGDASRLQDVCGWLDRTTQWK